MSNELAIETVVNKETFSPEESRLMTRFGEFLRNSVTHLVETGFRGYNLVRHRGQYCAVSLSCGAVDLDATAEATFQTWRQQRLYLTAGTMEALKEQIIASGYRLSPELLEAGYHGYNLVGFRDQVFALHCSLGQVDLASLSDETLGQLQQTRKCVVGQSTQEVMDALEAAVGDGLELVGIFATQPRLVRENYHGYNIVHYGERYFALHLSLGVVDLTSIADDTLAQLERTRKCVVGQSLQQVEHALHTESPLKAAVPPNRSNSPRMLETAAAAVQLPTARDSACGKEENLTLAAALRDQMPLRKDASLVDELPRPVPAETSPTIASESVVHPQYRSVEHEGMLYAIPERLGTVIMGQPAARNLPEILSARTRKAMEVAVEKALRPQSPAPEPQLIERNYRGYQIFTVQGVFLATESAREGLDMVKLRSARPESFFAAVSLLELKQKVDASRQVGERVLTERALIMGADSPERTREIIGQSGYQNVTVLVKESQQAPSNLPCIVASEITAEVVTQLRAAQYELVVASYGQRLGEVAWEKLAAQFCRRLLAVFPDGSSRLYEGDHFSRVLYNMAYLRSMYCQVPPLAGQRVLEVGCSDGLTCDLVAHEGAASVTGVDLLESVGLLYPNPRCVFHKLDAATLPFEDQTFDLVYSIATFEHVSDPLATLKEMKRLLRPGGYGYVQAAPLYYSPFGHHMFGYFDHYPWIHVRLSKTEIVEYAQTNGIAARIEGDRGLSAADYIQGMINLRHINGKLLHEFRLKEFTSLPGVEMVRFIPSYEGENLITPEVLAETRPVKRQDLIRHGFELVFRVK